jgi:hypothetical protein
MAETSPGHDGVGGVKHPIDLYAPYINRPATAPRFYTPRGPTLPLQSMRRRSMFDAILIAAGTAGFGLTILYAFACERL